MKKNTYVVGTVILRRKIESRLVLSVPSTIEITTDIVKEETKDEDVSTQHHQRR